MEGTEPNNGQQQPVMQTQEPPVIAAAETPVQTPAPQPVGNEVATSGTTEEPKPKKPVALIILTIVAVALIAAVATLMVFSMQNNGPSKPEGGPTDPDTIKPVSMEDFDFKFIKLENEDGKNIIYSPLSIKYALAMLSDAAAGESKSQIDSLVGNFTIKKYTNNDKQSLANAIFVRESISDEIYDSYKQNLESRYSASVILDPFTSEAPINNWVNTKTFGLINNLLSEGSLDRSIDFVLVNALAINMNWNYRLQCHAAKSDVPCKLYSGKHFIHENYKDSVKYLGEDFDTTNFNNQEVSAAEIAASVNNYDIVSTLGEEYIRSTVQSAYDEWLEEVKEDAELYPNNYDLSFDIDKYMEELDGNYGKTASSTDFYLLDTETEKVFAKDLEENEGSTLRYVGIMPKSDSISAYVDNITTEKITNIVNNLKDVSTVTGFKEGVITKVRAYIPFFNFDYNLELKDDLESLGVKNVFSPDTADLSQMTSWEGSYIHKALHKANIDFSNNGIKAAAATALAGGLGAGGNIHFEYDWDVPVEEIDLTFNKPFFFMIYDKDNGEVWFTGIVYNPAG